MWQKLFVAGVLAACAAGIAGDAGRRCTMGALAAVGMACAVAAIAAAHEQR
jgi:hypothetical protein